LCTLLDLGNGVGARSVAIGGLAQQALAYGLRGKPTSAWFVEAHLIGSSRGDLHEVLAQRAQAGGLGEQVLDGGCVQFFDGEEVLHGG
jgi:hypothetical protein